MSLDRARPLVSVIINCFNGAKYLSEAIDSALAQTFLDIELIIWDNQSVDNSAEVALSFSDTRIRYIYAPTHTRLGQARNEAVRQARGDWVAFLDSDDIWLPNKLALQLRELEKPEIDSSIGMVYSRCTLLGGVHDGQIAPLEFIGKDLPQGRILEEYLSKENFILLVTALVRRDLYLQLGGVPEDFNQAEDYYLFAGIASISSVSAIQETTCIYRIHANNLSKQQISLSCDESVRVIKRFHGNLSSYHAKKAANLQIRRLNCRQALWRIRHEPSFYAVVVLVKCGPTAMLTLIWPVISRRIRNILGSRFYN